MAELAIMNAATLGLLTLSLVDRYTNNSRVMGWLAQLALRYSAWRYLSWPRKNPGDRARDMVWTIFVCVVLGAIITVVMDAVWLASVLLP